MTPLRWLLLGLVAVGLVAGAVLSGRMAVPGTGGGGEPRGRLGPTPGPSSEGYVEEKRAFLESVASREPDRAAASLVSLRRRLGVPEIRDLTSGGTVLALYVFGEGGEPSSLLVGGDLQGAEETLGGPCGCVYAFVVQRTTLGSLLALQRDEAVRLVDVPDPPVDDLRGWELVPILPRE